MVWGGGGLWLARRLDARDAATVDAMARAARAPLDEAESVVRREAGVLAHDAAVVDSVARHDAAALARGAVRIRTLTLDGEADCVLIVDDNGVALAQLPANLSLPRSDTVPPPTPNVALRVLDGHSYLLARSAIQSADGPVGVVVVGLRLDRLATEAGTPTVALVATDRLLGPALSGAPDAGWSSITQAGHLVVGSERWLVRPAGRVGDDTAWALIPERLVGRERGWLWGALIGSFVLTATSAALALVLPGRRRGSASSGARSVPEIERRNRELEALYAAAVTMGSSSDLVSTAEQTLDVVLARGQLARRHGLPAGLRARTPDPHRQPRPDAGAGRSVARAARGCLAHRRGGATRAVRDHRPHEPRRSSATRCSAAPSMPAAVSHPAGAADLRRRRRCGACWRWSRQAARPSTTTCSRCSRASPIRWASPSSRAALLAETQEKSRRLETLARLAQGLTATLSGDQVLERVVGAAVELLGGSIARLWLLDDDGQRLTAGRLGGAGAGARGPALAGGRRGAGRARRRAGGTPSRCPTSRATRRRATPPAWRRKGSPRRPVSRCMVGARVLGALAVGTTERHDYTEEELSLLQSLANQAAIAIDNARLFFEEQTRRAYLNALLEINTKIGALAPTETLLTSIAEEAARLLASTTPASACWRATSSSWPGMAGTAVADDGPSRGCASARA